MEPSKSFQFCFDISFEKNLNAYIPSAYIVEDASDIKYLDKKASADVLESFGVLFENLDANTKKILTACDSLKPDFIFKKFSAKIKSAKTIADLQKDSKIDFAIRQHLQLNLDSFYSLIVKEQFPLSVNMGAEKDFYRSRVSTNSLYLEPQIQFNKHPEGITYTLSLKENITTFSPLNSNIEILLDEPSWLIIDKKLGQLKDLNSKKLLPFLKKKSIEIPSKLVDNYFKNFIPEIAKKIDIEATGFEMEQRDTIVSCTIEPVYDFFKNCYYLNLFFDYNGYLFDAGKSKKTHSFVDFSIANEPKIIQFKRSAAEILYTKKLLEIGLVKIKNELFGWNPDAVIHDPYANIQLVIDHKEELENFGFSIQNLKLESKEIITEKHTISASKETKGDWFDIKIIITIGTFTINFSEIIPNIKSKERLFVLPDGSYFLIPLEWLSKYSSLAKLARTENGDLLLRKSNFAALDAIPEIKNDADPIYKAEYAPSDLLKASLRPYQVDGVKWLLGHFNSNLGACLADDMGLGKTLQTLAVLVAVQEQLGYTTKTTNFDLFQNETVVEREPLKALIVLPSSLVFNWYNEAAKFTPHFSKMQYVGNDRKLLVNRLESSDLIFTSYNIVHRDISILEKYNFRYLILDESQYIKNKNSKIFKAINKIDTDHKIALSGTPIENSLDDLWSQMQFINPDILGSYNFFAENFKIPIEKKQDEDSLSELKNLIQPYILRRTKEQVLKDLPELTEQIYYCNMDPEQEKLYEKEKSKARNFLLKTDGTSPDKISIINTLMKLRQLSNHPKMIDQESEIDSGKYIAVTNYLENLVKGKQKTIIFSSFVTNLNFYTSWCKENKIAFCEITGETPSGKREQQVNLFQENEDPLLFFISLKAGGVGLNITKASYVLFLDPWWNPFAEKQGVARAHRIGQLNKVNVIRFISKNTVEEKIIKLQENKKLLSDSLLEESYINDEIEVNLEYILNS
ncbi:non-specific serine/threonine protein kinase [Flavobacterium araucananum]|uniref:Serine/threonine protein kinase n=1 Tax=Flavobacterium araucananum TaxID=946678 RepID=A0A227NU52_9FLAO|nr:DEAD/DEAH box helicase [Flavobacterium araucananum]OXG00863.1 serine/threonine protein kinase [Flavobacterium araucananum]PWK03229.1 non-specific serine/threonine protein kinase [Flavobacterium araucananum]